VSDAPEVVLWRHGRTEWNAVGRFQGQLDSPLDETGRAQVVAGAAEVARSSPRRIVSSDATRALHTADALATATGLPVVVDPRLREVHLGQWSGLTREEVQERFPDEYAAWIAGEDISRGGGETFVEVGERALACMREHLERVDDGSLVLVTHGGTALSLLVEVLGVPRRLRRVLGPLGNAHWSRLVQHPSGWRLAEHNVGATAVGTAAAVAPAVPVTFHEA
jgi:glucosyl-3-phosphoglycerate phosphatase